MRKFKHFLRNATEKASKTPAPPDTFAEKPALPFAQACILRFGEEGEGLVEGEGVCNAEIAGAGADEGV